jgi:hypothetical protein
VDRVLHPLEVLALLNLNARIGGVTPTRQRDELGLGDVRVARHLADVFDEEASHCAQQ